MSLRAQEAEALLKIAAKRLVRAYPFHAHLLALARLLEEPDVKTMGVTVRAAELTLLFNTDFVLDCDLGELEGVLHHEVLHVLFGHLMMGAELYPDAVALTIAEEVTVNEFVPERLPGRPILLKQFPRLPALEDTETRYRRLASRGSSGRDPGPIDDHGVWDDVRAQGQGAEAIIMSAVERAAGNTTAEEMDRTPQQMQEIIEKARRGAAAGRSVEGVSANQADTVPWQQVLRRFVGRQTIPQPSYLRPPRRFPELVGILPGTARKQGRPRVMAVIDTSGSITSGLLEQIARELQRLGTSHEVVVVECDAEIHRTYAFKGELTDVCGRGGTDLCPPFEPAVLAKIRPDVLVYFTDGQGPAPVTPPRVPVLWCLTPGATVPAKWGRTVWMT